jgi:hypothetical protein
MTSSPQDTRTHWRYAPRFSLAAVLLVVTICAVGLWYWFRVPFEITRESEGRKEVETVCRTWNGTVRHGPRHVYLDGRLSQSENYRNGVADGAWQWIDAEQQPYNRAEFDRGKLISFQAERCEPRLARHLAERTIADPLVVQALLEPITVQFLNWPLKDAAQELRDMTGVYIVLDVRRLEEAGINLDSPVSTNAQSQPLIVALKQLLAAFPLAADYRYGTLVITSAQSAESWQDPTGVTTITPTPGSALAKEWNKPTRFQFIETPMGWALSSIEKQHRIKFDLSKLVEFERQVVGHEIPVTCNLNGLSLRDSLGILFEPLKMRVTLQGETLVVQPP